MKSDVDALKTKIEALVHNFEKELGDEFYYASLPLCIIDSVFSVGVKYESVRNAVGRFCDKFSLTRFRPHGNLYPIQSDQLSVNKFIDICSRYSNEELAAQVFGNRQRTSTRNGILKAQAVLEFAQVLDDAGIQYFQDLKDISDNDKVERKIRTVKGQGSGFSYAYFLMLAGNDQKINPSRKLISFSENALGRACYANELQDLYERVCEILKSSYPSLTPRMLDYQVWSYQKSLEGNKK